MIFDNVWKIINPKFINLKDYVYESRLRSVTGSQLVNFSNINWLIILKPIKKQIFLELWSEYLMQSPLVEFS